MIFLPAPSGIWDDNSFVWGSGAGAAGATEPPAKASMTEHDARIAGITIADLTALPGWSFRDTLSSPLMNMAI
jgi:hypothetical protein